MTLVTTIIEALRKVGSPTQKTAIERQDQHLRGKVINSRSMSVARSELGTTQQFVANIEAISETVVPLEDVELTSILENAALVEDFIIEFLGQTQNTHFLDSLDDAFGAWSESDDKKGYSNEGVIQIFGAGFGQFCVETLDMRWVRITDMDGEACAIQGQLHDYRSFPFHSVVKRVTSGEIGFFKNIYISLQDMAQQDLKLIKII